MGHPLGEDLYRCFDPQFLQVSGCLRAWTESWDGVGVTLVSSPPHPPIAVPGRQSSAP